MSAIQDLNLFGMTTFSPSILPPIAKTYRQTYEQNRHRIYALAFWMTDHELAAEVLMTQTFRRAFSDSDSPSAEEIDKALLRELRDCMPVGVLTLTCSPCNQVLSVRNNILRVDLERAVVALPCTERLIFLMHDVEDYDVARIARTLNLSAQEVRYGLHQARLRIRELLAE